MHEQKNVYSLRKLSVGLASVIVGTCFFISNGQNVKADTVNAGEQPTSTVIQQDRSKKQEQDSNEQNDQTNVSNSKTEQQQSTPSAKDVENVESNLNDTNKLDNATKTVEVKSEANQKFDQVKDKFKQDTSIDADVPSSVTKDVKKIQTNTLKVVKESTVNPNSLSLKESKAVNLNNNGGFDSSWGTLDVNDWKGNVQGDYYQLTDYTGDANHIIVPNEADFAKAGISTSDKQVGVTSDLMHTIFRDKTTDANATVAFSKTDNKMVKAIDSNWSNTWEHEYSYPRVSLSKFDGANLDVSNVTSMTQMFEQNQISNLSSLAGWHVDNVTDMSSIFSGNQISDLSPLANWHTDNVKNMSNIFQNNQIKDLSPLANWRVDNVIGMGNMFEQNEISDISSLANWRVDNVKNMNHMFHDNQIIDLSPLANWNVDNVVDMGNMFEQNEISDLSPLANWKVDNVNDMREMFEQNQISDLSPLANWKVDNVHLMGAMFVSNQISDLSPLANWKVDNVVDMSNMFSGNQISDLSPLANWNVNNVVEMFGMFGENQISNLSPLANWKVDNVDEMGSMFYDNQISDLSPLAGWNTNNVTDMSQMFYGNHISDISPLANWNVNSVNYMYSMFDNNSSIITQAKRVINFIYPNGYTGKKQGPVTQTVDLPQKIKIDLTMKYDHNPSNNILDWVTKTETPQAPDPVYFQDYTVPEIKGLLEPDQTVISGQQADITKPINVTVTYKLVDSNTNDAFALDSKHGLHEHENVNDNGGYDADFWGKINVDDWNYTVNNDRIEINGLKDGALTGANDAVIVPNLDDFKLAGKDGGAKTVYISKDALRKTVQHKKYYGLSKTNDNTFATDSDISFTFGYNSNLTHADLNSLNTSNVTDMSNMFVGDNLLMSSLTSLDVSHWDTGNVTNMSYMFSRAKNLTNLDVSKWNTSKVTDMSWMFYNARSLTSLDVSNWDTGKVTKVTMDWMFNSASSLALIVNGDKFADYLVKNNFAYSGINSSVKSVTTDNTKLLQMLTNDSQHDSANKTIVFTFPANYSPDLTKYHLTKTGNTYQIKQSADYDKPYLQGTVLINATGDIAKHHIDTTKPNEISSAWQPNYDKLVLAHKNSDGSVSFDTIRLPQIPGYKAIVKTVANPVNPASALFAVSFMVLPKPATSLINDTKPAETVTPATPATTEIAKPIKTEPKVTISAIPKAIDLSNDAVATTPDVSTWQVANEPSHDTYHVSNGKYTVELPHISNAQLHVIANDSTKDSILFTYKRQKAQYVFKIKFANGHYLLTTYKIKSGKLVKLIDYNFVKSSKMIDVILAWLQLE